MVNGTTNNTTPEVSNPEATKEWENRVAKLNDVGKEAFNNLTAGYSSDDVKDYGARISELK